MSYLLQKQLCVWTAQPPQLWGKHGGRETRASNLTGQSGLVQLTFLKGHLWIYDYLKELIKQILQGVMQNIKLPTGDPI